MDVRSYPFERLDRLELNPGYVDVREREPLCPVRMQYGPEAWLVARYEDARTVQADLRFSRAAARVHDEPRPWPVRFDTGIMDLDSPEHGRLRRLVAKAFTPRRVEELRPRAQEVAEGLLDRMVEAGPPADLVERFAVPLPSFLFSELLGVPYEDRDRFLRWGDAFMSTTALSPEQKAADMEEYGCYIARLVAARRQQPADDLLSAMVQARDADDRLSEEELVGLAAQLLPAGYETTAGEIANFVFVLLCHPDQLELLRGRPDLIPTAVEELLRYVPLTSGNTLPRYATEAVELSGGTVPAGSWVLFSAEAADRDPRVFAEPDRLDLTRSPNPHMAFGVGQHTCLGAHLARMELQVALGSLLRRLPGLRLAVPAGDLRWKMGTTVQGPVALPVAW